jgi:hypothetical protein
MTEASKFIFEDLESKPKLSAKDIRAIVRAILTDVGYTEQSKIIDKLATVLKENKGWKKAIAEMESSKTNNYGEREYGLDETIDELKTALKPKKKGEGKGKEKGDAKDDKFDYFDDRDSGGYYDSHRNDNCLSIWERLPSFYRRGGD